MFLLLPGGHTYPGSWEPVVVPNLVRRCRNPQLEAACHWVMWASPLCQAALPTQTQPQKTASSSPGLSWTAWKSSSASPVDPLQSPYMTSPHWKTHSNKRLWTAFITGLDWWVVSICDWMLCADWALVLSLCPPAEPLVMATTCPFSVQKYMSWTKWYQTQWISRRMLFDGKLRFSLWRRAFWWQSVFKI